MVWGRVPSFTMGAYSTSEPIVHRILRPRTERRSTRIDARRRPVSTGANTLARFTTCRAAMSPSFLVVARNVRVRAARPDLLPATVHRLLPDHGKAVVDPALHSDIARHARPLALPDVHEGHRGPYAYQLWFHSLLRHQQQASIVIRTVIVPPMQLPSCPNGS